MELNSDPRRIGADEALFWACFAVHAVLPGRWQPSIEILGCMVMTQDLGLVALAGVLLAWRWPDLRFPPRPWLWIGGWLALVLAWGAVSVIGWAGTRDLSDAIGRLMPLVGEAGAFTAAYVLLATRDAAGIRAVLERAGLFLAGVGLAYALKSLLAPGLELSFVRDNEQRARGPLFGPAVGHLALLPALGMCLGLVLSQATRRWLWIGAAGALVIALIGLGSRGALLGVALFAAAATWRMPGAGRRLVLVGIVGAAALGAALLVATVAGATAERMRDTDDPFRSRTYATAATVMAEATPGQLLAGRGLGSVWPWYAEDAARYNWTSSDSSEQFWYNTPWGSSMLHAHSLPLYLVIEVGVPGALFALALIATLAAAWWRARFQHWRAGVASGLVASVTAIAFDLPLFKSFTLSCLWWLFLLGLLLTNEEPDDA